MRIQSAMEYLVTYGWAILVLTVALAALFSLGLLSPGKFAAQQCVVSSGFACLGYSLASNGILYLNLQQSTPDPISVTAVACAQNGIFNSLPVTAPISPRYLTVGANATFATQCYSNTGNFMSAIGGAFTGAISLNYTDQLTKLPGTAVGKIAVSVSSK